MCEEEEILSKIVFKGKKSKFLQLLPSSSDDNDENEEEKGSSYQKDFYEDEGWPMEDEIVEYLTIQSPSASLPESESEDDGVTTYDTDKPTSKPTTYEPTKNPTSKPTKKPTSKPTITPTSKPTKLRTKKPTPNPTSKPTKGDPTSQPSYEKYDGYFDYKKDSPYGPEEWSDVDVSDSEYFNFFEKFDNECNGPEQSPIDVEPNMQCPDDHKINFKNGRPKFNTLDFVILPQVLRAYLDQPSINNDDGGIYLGTRADFSNLSEYIPAVHVDVKVPSEHNLFGKQYAGEMNIAHYFDKGRGRIVYVTILMDATNDAKHEQLELFIKEWEEEALKRKIECDGKKYKRTYFQPGYDEMRKIWQLSDKQKSDWDLYKFATTTYHCGYEGSVTEPPCSERAIYRVLDLPMQISKDQKKRLKNLLLTTLDKNCNIPDIANEKTGGVNRPIQEQNDNNVFCCTSEDWPLKWEQEYWLSKWPKKYHGRKNIFNGKD